MAALDESTRRPSYWAVLPASVRYDPHIPASAKILYAELSALAESYGYAWPTNDYFERLYGVSERSVIRWLQALEAAGYIRIEGAGTTARKIWCGINPLGMQRPDDRFVGEPSQSAAPTAPPEGEPSRRGGAETTDKNVSGTDKNVSPTLDNKKNKQKRGTNPPKAPQGAREPKTAPTWKPERFEAFWRFYPAIPDGNGRGRRPAKDRAVRAWDKLRADDEELARMGKALTMLKASRQWKEGVGIPYASTWLNSRAWREEVEDLLSAEHPHQETERKEESIEWEN